MKILAILISIFSISVFAKIQPGTYVGHDEDGQTCQFTIGKTWFENNQPHPLNERIPVSSLQFSKLNPTLAQWNLQHPVVVDLKKGTARFDHDLLQSTVPVKSGALSLTLLKEEAETSEGHAPAGIIYIEDNYVTPTESKKVFCNLK